LPRSTSFHMPSRPSLLSGLFGMRCPRCRRGDLFPTGSFSFKQPFEQYEHCPKCGQDNFPEPGFYWGAMFLSYIGSGFFCLGFVMILHWVFNSFFGRFLFCPDYRWWPAIRLVVSFLPCPLLLHGYAVPKRIHRGGRCRYHYGSHPEGHQFSLSCIPPHPLVIFNGLT
jgi:uncharacterized protein (DUF983 family)